MPDLELLRVLAPPVEPPAPEAVARARNRMTRRRRRRPVLLATPIAVGAAVAALLVAQLGGGQEFATAAVRLAEKCPRLLLDGWTVTRVDEWDAESGEMTFAADGRELELQWSHAYEGPKEGTERVTSTRVAGAPTVVVRYPGTNDFTAHWRDGSASVSARGVFPSADSFVATLHRFEKAGVEEWLSALPASAVTPRAQAKAVDEMLAGLPLPPGFDADALRSTQTRDRYQLGARVTGAVACGWIARWIAGDQGAVAALASSRRWPILLEMNAAGDYPEVLWEYADAVTGTADVPGGRKGITVQESYKDALGC